MYSITKDQSLSSLDLRFLYDRSSKGIQFDSMAKHGQALVAIILNFRGLANLLHENYTGIKDEHIP